MTNLPPGTHVLSGTESQCLRAFCSSETFSDSDLDAYANLLAQGRATRKELADIAYGPTKIPLFNFLLQLTILNPLARASYIEMTRFLALDARVPVDSPDLSGTTAFMHSISTKPYWDPEFAEIMVEAGAEINRRNRYGCVAAHDIVMARDYSTAGQRTTVDALKWFVDKGGDLDIKCGDGTTPRKMGMSVSRLVPAMRTVLTPDTVVDTEVTASAGGGSKIGRNDPCHCGSKRKFKVCCGKN